MGDKPRGVPSLKRGNSAAPRSPPPWSERVVYSHLLQNDLLPPEAEWEEARAEAQEAINSLPRCFYFIICLLKLTVFPMPIVQPFGLNPSDKRSEQTDRGRLLLYKADILPGVV